MDDAFERGLWRGERRFMGRGNGATRRPWLMWMLIALPVVVLAAVLFWPGHSVSRDAGRTAVGSDAVWSGVIRHNRQPRRDSAGGLAPVALNHAGAPLKGSLMVASRSGAAAAGGLSHGPALSSHVGSSAPVPDMIEQIQHLLNERGYAPGPVDGKVGNRTRIAIMAWQLDQGVPVSGKPDETILNRLINRHAALVSPRRVSWQALTNHERTIVGNWCEAGADRSRIDPNAYYVCLGEQMGQLTTGVRMPIADDGVIATRQLAIAHAACVDSLGQGPQTYFNCVDKQMDAALAVVQANPRG